MKRLLAFLLCSLFLTGCASNPVPEETFLPEPVTEETRMPETTVPETVSPPEPLPPDPVEELLQSMPLEDWVGQLFLVGADPKLAELHVQEYNLGKFLLFADDFKK